MIRSRLVVTPNLCIGCRTCELACAFTKSIDGRLGRSRIYPLFGGEKDLYTPVICLHCDDPACMKSCLVGAISRNEETGAIEINQEKCVKCRACVAACPFGCALVDVQHNMIVKCDLCSGDPACARFCPTKALEYRPVAEMKRLKAG